MRRPFSRLIVLIIFLGAGAFFYWQQNTGLVDTSVAFVLTDLEVPTDAGILRYEHVTMLTVDIIDAQGASVAQINHRRPGAVAKPPPLRLPKGTYTLRIRVALKSRTGVATTRNYLRSQELAGSPITIRM